MILGVISPHICEGSVYTVCHGCRACNSSRQSCLISSHPSASAISANVATSSVWSSCSVLIIVPPSSRVFGTVLDTLKLGSVLVFRRDSIVGTHSYPHIYPCNSWRLVCEIDTLRHSKRTYASSLSPGCVSRSVFATPCSSSCARVSASRWAVFPGSSPLTFTSNLSCAFQHWPESPASRLARSGLLCSLFSLLRWIHRFNFMFIT